MIGRRGERGSGTSVLAARHDDDEIEILDRNVCFGSLPLFNGISKFLGYLMRKL